MIAKLPQKAIYFLMQPTSMDDGIKMSAVTLCEEKHRIQSIVLSGTALVSLTIDGEERVCLAQLSNTLLKNYSYNEIHNR